MKKYSIYLFLSVIISLTGLTLSFGQVNKSSPKNSTQSATVGKENVQAPQTAKTAVVQKQNSNVNENSNIKSSKKVIPSNTKTADVNINQQPVIIEERKK